MTDIMDIIRDKQRGLKEKLGPIAPHKPEMLYIGCVDARLDPVKDIGIDQGKALIYRNIGAVVRPADDKEIPESVSMGAVLEFFLSNITAPPDENGKPKTKHIVVSGHTHCGGICACYERTAKEGGYLERYLSAIVGALKKIICMSDPAKSKEEQLRALEKESVRQSIKNLMTYDIVKQACDRGEVELHGWVIDTHSQRIEELGKDNRFHPMGDIKSMNR